MRSSRQRQPTFQRRLGHSRSLRHWDSGWPGRRPRLSLFSMGLFHPRCPGMCDPSQLPTKDPTALLCPSCVLVRSPECPVCRGLFLRGAFGSIVCTRAESWTSVTTRERPVSEGPLSQLPEGTAGRGGSWFEIRGAGVPIHLQVD